MPAVKPAKANQTVKLDEPVEGGRAIASQQPGGTAPEVRNSAQKPGFPAIDPAMYTPPVEQTEMVRRWMSGQSISRISREMHRNRRTVARVVKSEEMQATAEEMKGALLGTWREWLGAIRRSVNTGRNRASAKLAISLFQAFGALPVVPRKKRPSR